MTIKRKILSLSKGKQQDKNSQDASTSALGQEIQTVQVPTPDELEVSQGDISVEEVSKKVIQREKEPSRDKVKKTKSFNSLDEILLDVFKKELKADGKVKPLKVDKAHESALKKLNGTEPSVKSTWEEVILTFSDIDPTFRYLLQLVLVSSDVKPIVRRQLLDFSVLAISRNWSGKLAGSNNVFAELAGTVGIDNPDSIAVICKHIKDLFDKQIENRKKVEANKTSDIENQLSLSVSDVKRKKSNIIAICCLWASETGKSSPEKVITQLKNFLLSDDASTEVDTSLVSFFFAGSVKEPTPQIKAVVRYIEDNLARSEAKRKSAQWALGETELKIANLQRELQKLNVEISEKNTKIDLLLNEIADHKNESHQKELSEQATRVHLRDDAGQAKAKAKTLLSDDVAPAMELSLKALNRDNPKVEVAIHQIELALESINRGLPWFNK